MTLFVLLAATVAVLPDETGAASARVTLSVYARVVPSCAVTTTEMLVVTPDATAMQSMITVAWLSATTDVTVTDETLMATEVL